MENNNHFVAIFREELIFALNRLLYYDVSNRIFTKNCYEIFANDINRDLKSIRGEEIEEYGQIIDWQTLRKIISYGYHLSVPTNKKQYKTLSKIAIYLKYKNWNDFIDKKCDSDLLYTKIDSDLFESVFFLNDIIKHGVSKNLRKYFTGKLLKYLRSVLKEPSFVADLKKKTKAYKVEVISQICLEEDYCELQVKEKVVEKKKKYLGIQPGFLMYVEETNYCVYSLTFEEGRWKLSNRSLIMPDLELL